MTHGITPAVFLAWASLIALAKLGVFNFLGEFL